MPVVKALMGAGADLDSPDAAGRTPLMVAAAGGHLEIVKLMVNAGANPFTTDNRGKTVLDYAEMRHNPEVSDYVKGIVLGTSEDPD